jgi:hypothetical protein
LRIDREDKMEMRRMSNEARHKLEDRSVFDALRPILKTESSSRTNQAWPKLLDVELNKHIFTSCAKELDSVWLSKLRNNILF